MRPAMIVATALMLASSAEARQHEETIELRRGLVVVRLIPWGATMMQVVVPNRGGRPANVVLGHATPEEIA
jgi:aldose 1-epimerase